MTNDFYRFTRQLKLHEYFYENPKKTSPENTDKTLGNSECDPLNWRKNNPDWYPQEVKENRSKGLNSFIEKVLFESNEGMKKHKSKSVNNSTPKQRIALESLTKNKNIVFMLSDKDGSIIVLDKEKYDKVCLDILMQTIMENLMKIQILHIKRNLQKKFKTFSRKNLSQRMNVIFY